MAVIPRPYVPSFIVSAVSGSRPVQLTFRDVVDTNISSTASFIYDPLNNPLKSTQQLNVDWSKFENHTFFMSAEAKVNLAFDQIINGYPFDGTRAETEQFFERLTGFDNWVFEQFPKYRGQLMFSSGVMGGGSYIAVKDAAGSLFPELAKNSSGDAVLNPIDGASMTIEMHLFVPQQENSGSIVCQKMSGSQGFAVYLEPTSSISNVEARFTVVSGSNSFLTTRALLDKGVFNHVAVEMNRDGGISYLQFFKSGRVIDTTSNRCTFGDLDISASDLTIGSGSAFTLGTSSFVPTTTLSASLDEFRLWHSVRTIEQLQQYMQKPVFAQDALKIYYKFNEPPPNIGSSVADPINGIVLDASGNSLHALIVNFTGSLRQDAALDPNSLMIYEKDITSPVLFPAHSGVIDLNASLLVSASDFDQANPNIITRLVPKHYLLDGAALEGFSEPEGGSGTPFGGTGIPGQGKLSNVQMMLTFLYIYARFFDEIKLYVDSFSTLRFVNYDTFDSTPDNFLLNLIEQFGFHLPPLFNDSTIEQYVRAENITPDITTSEHSLKFVQSQLLRRVMVNMPDVLRSKGTQHSIKAFLRAIGIDPDNSVRIREFGGPTSRHLTFARETKREPGLMVDFITSSLAVTPFLSASRTEPGFPPISGTFVSGTSNNVNDGLLTSGSWTIESTYQWTPVHLNSLTSVTQSLFRLCVTGSTTFAKPGLVLNVMAISSSNNPRIEAYFRPGAEIVPSMFSSAPLLTMSIPMIKPGVFNGDRWNISFGCERNDAISSRVSSSYFLRVASQTNGEIESYQTTSSFFYELSNSTSQVNALRTLHMSSSMSGAFLAIGKNQSIPAGVGVGALFLNDTFSTPSISRTADLTALVSNLRFWPKAISEDEWREHIRNFKSAGVEDPLVNYNFVTTRTGSFERLRLNTLTKQETRDAVSGSITFIDFSQNLNHATGSGFTAPDVFKVELFDYSYISPYFDEATSNEKIRARSFLNQDIVDVTPWASVAPINEIVKSEEPTDDTRFSIEFSLVDALNRDIITLFATLDAIDNAIGSPELMFSPDYPDLDNLRNVYFNRISEKLNFRRFFEFFRWFDTSIGTFIEQLIPRKTNFKGTHFTIESHMMERHKVEYLSNEMYLNESNRQRPADVILLQQIDGTVRKY